jgi:cation diffusion facilitator family transporter
MQNDKDIKSHYNQIRSVLWIVLALNWAVAAAKMAYGYMTKCSSMTADGFHSLSDGTSNIIGLIGIGLCAQPVDHDHPYGHKKYETLFSMGIAVLLFIVAFNLAKGGLARLFHPVSPEVTIESFIVMIITMAVNITVMVYEYRKGKELKSDILVVDSLHTRADIFTSFSVIIALIGVKMGFPIVDPIVTLVIAVFIVYAAFVIVKEESGILVDAAITDPKKIEAIVLKVNGVISCHKIRTRGRPDDIYIDLHVQLAPETHLDDAHDTSYAIEGAIKEAIPEVTDVLVHLEPEGKRQHKGGRAWRM